MVVEGQTIKVLAPAWVKPGFYFKTCRQYRSKSGFLYNYKLYNKHGRELALQEREHSRKYLSYNFPTRSGKQSQLNIHRVFAFNGKKCNFKPPPHRWAENVHVHHNAKPAKEPWTNCTWQNMCVVTKSVHERWHHKRTHVPHCLGH